MISRILMQVWRGFSSAALVVLIIVCVAMHSAGFRASDGKEIAQLLFVLYNAKAHYVDETETETLVRGAMDGLMRSLGDPHSTYLDPEKYERMRDHGHAQFGGIGVVMSYDEGVKIINVMEGTPGEAAGLAVGDRILAVDGTSAETLGFEGVATSVRGKAGTEVVLTIGRGNEAPRDVVITRDYIHVKTAAAIMVKDVFGYMRISSFSESTAKEFEENYTWLQENGMQAMILDLRANPGGYIDACVAIAKHLVPKGPIVSVVARDGTREEYASSLETPTVPMVVLIDKNSASASELLAGALQDTEAATVVGQTSYGKGSVQVLLPLKGHGDAIKLTIAKYFTPKGRSLHGVGITPNVEVALPEDSSEDTQLLTALRILAEKIGVDPATVRSHEELQGAMLRASRTGNAVAGEEEQEKEQE